MFSIKKAQSILDWERIPQAPSCKRGKGRNIKQTYSLPGSPALWAGSFTIILNIRLKREWKLLENG